MNAFKAWLTRRIGRQTPVYDPDDDPAIQKLRKQTRESQQAACRLGQRNPFERDVFPDVHRKGER